MQRKNVMTPGNQTLTAHTQPVFQDFGCPKLQESIACFHPDTA